MAWANKDPSKAPCKPTGKRSAWVTSLAAGDQDLCSMTCDFHIGWLPCMLLEHSAPHMAERPQQRLGYIQPLQRRDFHVTRFNHAVSIPCYSVGHELPRLKSYDYVSIIIRR